MKLLDKIRIIFSMALLGLSCTKVLEPEPIGLTNIDNFYSDTRGVFASINSVYAALVERSTTDATSVYVEPVWQLGDVASDDTQGGDGTLDELTFGAGNGNISTYWAGSYKGIYRANVVITRLPQIEFNASNKPFQSRIIGEALFLRALNYFNLVKAFGDVPLITKEILSVSETMVSRDPAEKVWAQIETDLAEAIKVLPSVYSGNGAGNEKGRATSGAAKSLLAKVYLTQGKFAQAAAIANDVIQSGVYKLNTSYESNFKGNSESATSTETIFEAQHGAQQNGAFTTTYFSPQVGGVGDINYPTDEANRSGQNPNISSGGLIQAFEANDVRRTLIKDYGLTAATGKPYRWLLDKFWKPNPQVPFKASDVNYPILRYADVLLMYAEATNEVSGPTQASIDAVNLVRARAGLSTFSLGLTKDQFREIIYKERRTEFFGEGQRFWDLKRTGRLIPVMTAHLGRPVESRIVLLPIPQSERNLNPNLTQNTGY